MLKTFAKMHPTRTTLMRIYGGATPNKGEYHQQQCCFGYLKSFD